MRTGSIPVTRTTFNIMKLATSPDRGTFGIKGLIKRAEEKGIDPDIDQHTQEMLNYEREWHASQREREQKSAWQENNMEYDLRTCDWMIDKCQKREEYAQNLYAAMCNRSFQKNAVWDRLKNTNWSCSWRYAGGIVADMRGKGDYIDWYCSGIRGGLSEQEIADMEPEDREKYLWMQANFVSESYVTDEIRNDLYRLGWLVLDEDFDID